MIINKRNKYIRNLDIFLWNTCNLKCDYCYLEPIINSREAFVKKTEISKDIISSGVDIFFAFDELNNKKITFTWGESFIYIDKIWYTIDYLINSKFNIKKNISISINTNWLLFNDNIYKLINKIISNNFIFSLNISLDWDLKTSIDNRFLGFSKIESENMYYKILKNIKIFKEIFWQKININISTTFSSKTYNNLLSNYLYLKNNNINNYINNFSLRPALWDWGWNINKLEILKKIIFTIKMIEVKWNNNKKINTFDNKNWIECILSEIVLAPDWNFYKCEFLIWNNNIIIWDINNWIKEKFLTCIFDSNSDICKFEKCVWCSTYCQNDMQIIWDMNKNKIYLQQVMQLISKFYKSF